MVDREEMKGASVILADSLIIAHENGSLHVHSEKHVGRFSFSLVTKL